ncbi:MAG: Gfo/Idh/MocA family oxidoreductase [Betaproteobacteria bacterium]|nr:Gfo/Idh/MocA family oxidoreductase [Betaproteobacteria bacterium]
MPNAYQSSSRPIQAFDTELTAPILVESSRMMLVPDNSSIRVAVVGAGLMGRWHAYAAQRLGAEVAAIVDCAPDAALSLAQGTERAAVFTEIGAMLEAVRPHVVHICTPVPSHLPLTLQVIEAGAHALVEKPLTHFAAQTQVLLQKAHEKGVHVCPVHQFGFQSGVARAAKALNGLGDVLHANFTICSAGGGVRTGAALDHIVGDILPHPFSILQTLWPGNSLQAQGWTANSRRNGELHVQGSTGGIAVSLYVSMYARPTRCDLDILCSGGSIHLNFFHGYAIVRHGKPSRMDKVAQPFLFAGKTFAIAAINLAGRALRREMAYPGLSTLIGRFYAAARGADDNPISAQATLAAAIVREHIIQQAIPGVLLESGSAAPRV